VPTFLYRSRILAPAATVYDWHARPGALHRLLPPWENIRVVERSGGIAEGARTVMRMRRGPLPIRWVAVHGNTEPGRSFVDEQRSGPFAVWRHTHRFIPEAGPGSTLQDEIAYRLPLHRLVHPLAGRSIRHDLERTFRFRHRRTAHDIERHAAYGGRPLRVGITGASGLVGSQLSAFLTAAGHSVHPLVRRTPRPGSGEIYWMPSRGEVDAGALAGVDAVVHLAGRSIAAWRWTPRIRRQVRDSRVDSTRLLAEVLAGLPGRKPTLIAASAVGYYGDRGVDRVVEDDGPGDGFLADVCRQWEAAVEPARAAGARVVNLRFGLIVAAAGGFISRMLPIFRLGLGGRLGNGSQFMSWIALDDVLGVILHSLRDERLSGPLNVTAPEAVTNAELTRCLGRVLRRPTPFPVPAWLIRRLLGQMGEELFLFSARAQPQRLESLGFRFLFRELEEALRFELGRDG